MIYQKELTDCGSAVVRQIAVLMQHDRGFAACFLKTDCRTFSAMKTDLARLGLKSEGYLVDWKGLAEVRAPFIAQLQFEGVFHFVTILSVRSKRVIALDPAYGRRVFDAAEFEKCFTGRVLEIISREKKRAARFRLLSAVEVTWLWLLTLLESFFVLGLFFFLGDKKNLWICFASLLAMAAAVVWRRCYLLRLSKKIDHRLLIPHFFKEKDRDNYRRLQKIKTEHLRLLASLLVHGAGLGVILILMLVNDLYFFISSLIVILLTFLLDFCLVGRRKRLERIALELENKFEKDVLSGRAEAIKSYSLALKRSENYAFYVLLPRVILFILAIGMTLATAFWSDRLMPSYLIFNTSYLMVLSTIFSRVLNGVKNFD